MKSVMPWLQLVRLPNLFTAIADVVAGYWLVSDRLIVSARLALLCLASASLYAFGIVLNDIADIDVDRKERPTRPLPSGRVGPHEARRLAFALAIGGVLFAMFAGWDTTVENRACDVPGFDVRPTIVAIALVACISAYDLAAKGTFVGPLTMGLCRGLNLILGMCAAWWFTADIGLVPVVAMVLYIASITYFGVEEAGRSGRFRLATGGLGVCVAILVLGYLIAANTLSAQRESGDHYVFVVWLALLIHCGRLAFRAARSLSPRDVGRAMKGFILAIVVFDAVIAGAAQGIAAAGIVLALLIPAILLGRRLYST